MDFVFEIFFLFLFLIFLFFFFRKDKNVFFDKGRFVKKFNSIKQIGDFKMRIVEFDKLLDALLFVYGFRGTTYEKILKGKRYFSFFDDVKYAHRIRNKIVHEIDFEINKGLYRKVDGIFTSAFIDLGLFD